MVSGRKNYEDELLLGGQLLPLTGTVLFAEATPQECVNGLVEGKRGAKVLELTGSPLVAREVEDDSLRGLLEQLLPFHTQRRSNLFVRTANPSWTAIFENARRGLDPHSMMVWLGSIGIRCVSIVDFPNNYDRVEKSGFYGARRTETYDPDPGVPEKLGHTLGVQIEDSGRWEFMGPSDPVPAEYVFNPSAKRTPDKFTHDALRQTAANYGLRPFDDDFYAPDLRGIILEDGRAPDPLEKTWTLHEARNG